MRLISWRLFHYLKHNHPDALRNEHIDWDNYHDVLQRVWEVFFGRDITNTQGITEKTFPYVLSHTQLRPRQLIVLCNKIANFSQENGHFPYFDNKDILRGILEAQRDLADEIYNSYSSVYPNCGQIIDALTGLPVMFKGNRLDKVAPRTSSSWSGGGYSPLNFRKLVVELGVVGRVRQVNEKLGFVEADFEYHNKDRLTLYENDECVIHPLFYEKLRISREQKLRVYPFPDHPEFKALEYFS